MEDWVNFPAGYISLVCRFIADCEPRMVNSFIRRILRPSFCFCSKPLALIISHHALERAAGLGHRTNRRSPASKTGIRAGKKLRLSRPARSAFTLVASPGCRAQGARRKRQTTRQVAGRGHHHRETGNLFGVVSPVGSENPIVLGER